MIANIRAAVIPSVPAVLLANRGVLVFHRNAKLASTVGGVIKEVAGPGINATGLGIVVPISDEMKAAGLQRVVMFDQCGTTSACPNWAHREVWRRDVEFLLRSSRKESQCAVKASGFCESRRL